VLGSNQFFANPLFVPDNAVQATIEVFAPVDLPIFVKQADVPTPTPGGYDFVRTNIVRMPPDHVIEPGRVDWFYGILNTTTQNVSFSISTDITTTNDHGNFLQVLSNMNNTLGPITDMNQGRAWLRRACPGRWR